MPETNAKKDNSPQVTHITIEGVQWDIERSFAPDGSLRHISQISHETGKEVRRIEYANGVPVKITLPEIVSYDCTVELSLKPDGQPDRILLSDKAGLRREGVFESANLIRYVNSQKDVVSKATSLMTSAATLQPANAPAASFFDPSIIKEAPMGFRLGNHSDVVDLTKKSDQSGYLKSAVARCYMPLREDENPEHGVDTGLPDTPIMYRAVSLWPNGKMKRANSKNHQGRALQTIYNELEKVIATRSVEITESGAEHVFLREIQPKSEKENVMSAMLLTDTNGNIQSFSLYSKPEGILQYVVAFYKSDQNSPVNIAFKQFDEKGVEIPSSEVNDFPYAALTDKAIADGLSPDQKETLSTLRFLIEYKMHSLYNRFADAEHKVQEMQLAEVPHPLECVKSDWKPSEKFSLDNHLMNYDGAPGEALMWKDAEGKRQHFTQLRPDGKPFRDIWYENDVPVQIDFYGASPSRVMTLMLGERQKTDSCIIWKGGNGKNPQTIYRFNLHKDVLLAESHNEGANAVYEFPASQSTKIIPAEVQSAYAISIMQIPGVDTGLALQKDIEPLVILPNGTLRKARFAESDGSFPISEVSPAKKFVHDIFEKTNTHHVRLYDEEERTIAEWASDPKQHTESFRWFYPADTIGEKNPPVQVKIEINLTANTFSVRKYDQPDEHKKSRVAAEATDVPLGFLGKTIPEEYRNKKINGTVGDIITSQKNLVKSLERARKVLDEHLHPARVTRVAITADSKEREYTYYAAGKEQTMLRTERLREDRSVKWRTEFQPDGSGKRIYYWKDSAKKEAPRVEIAFSAQPYEETNNHIHMVRLGEDDRRSPEHEAYVFRTVKEQAAEDAQAIMKAHSKPIIIDFHGVEQFDTPHKEAMMAVADLVAKEGKGREINVAIGPMGDVKKKAALERAIKEAMPGIAILPETMSRHPDLPVATLRTRREYDPQGVMVFKEEFEGGEHKSFTSYDPKTKKPKKEGSYAPFTDADIPARMTKGK